jgi:hypothetical protein
MYQLRQNGQRFVLVSVIVLISVFIFGSIQLVPHTLGINVAGVPLTQDSTESGGQSALTKLSKQAQCSTTNSPVVNTEISEAKSGRHVLSVPNGGIVYDKQIDFTFKCIVPINIPGFASFECFQTHVNRGHWFDCSSSYTHISQPGNNSILVRAIGSPQVDKTPATFNWIYNNICETNPAKCPAGR